MGRGHVQVINSVRDIQEKFQDILLLKKNVEIISTLFAEMTRIVSEQNDDINFIQEKIIKAKEKIEDGNKELDTAKDYFEKERANKCCFLVWLFMAFGAILVPIILGILNSNGRF
jgi:t-SNARE complex subunit (syntaxin)